MEVKPLAKYKSPAYPCREDVLENPMLLKSLPERWRGNVYVAAALSSLLLMTLTSCNGRDGGVKSIEAARAGQAVPIFVHGDGRGSFGCESVAPPAFLSEEEAFTVIAEEAKREGIVFKKDGPTLKNITIPKTDTFYDQNEHKKVEGRKGDLALDGIDESKGIAFEFVSRDDIYSWLDKNTGRASSVELFRFLDTANTLVNGMEGNTGSLEVATFYDPCYKYDTQDIKDIMDNNSGDYKVMEEKIKELVKGDLREQVRDFLSWLKGEGII